MSTEMQTKMQASPEQNFTPVQTGLLQRKSALCNTPGLVEDSGRDKEKLTLQRSLVDQAGTTTVPRFGHDFSRVSVHSTGPGMIQAKLKINEAGDLYEQEADRVAEQMMRMPDPVPVPQSPVNSQPEGSSIQSAGYCHEKDIQRKEDDCEEEGIVQMKQGSSASGVGGQLSGAVPLLVHEVLHSPGVPLDPATRTYMEPRFGHDFSRVRVHTGALAEQSAQDINASAYTMGHAIVFDAGRFAPGTQEGQRLIAHELTHVVQQSGSDGIRFDQSNDKHGLSPNYTIQQGAAPRQGNQPQPASETLLQARPAETPVIARKDGATGGPSHKANDPNQLKSKLHPSGKAHLYANQVASIYFGTKSYVPDQDDHKVLKALAQEYQYTAQRQGGLRGKVIGHADVEASSDPDNQELSFQRARWTAAVFKFHVADGTSVTAANLQFETEGAGTGFCMGDPECKGKARPDALAQYRRADVLIFTEKMPRPQVSSCPPASGAGVKTLGEYIELIRCAEVTTGFTPRLMLALLRQMYYGKPWSATTQDPKWDFVIPCSPDLDNPKDKLGQPLFEALHNTVTIEGMDLGHVFAGLEAMTCPASSVTMSMFRGVIKLTFDLSNESFATWGGDVGSVAGAFVACWMMTDQERATKGKDDCHQGSAPESLMQYFVKRQAPPEDLEGDIAPFVIRAAESGACGGSLEQIFTPQAPISSIFMNFFYNRGPTGMTSRDRYQCFAEAIGANVVNGQITNLTALIHKYEPGVLSFAWGHYLKLKKEIPRSDPIVPLLERNSQAALHLFFDWLQARMQP